MNEDKPQRNQKKYVNLTDQINNLKDAVLSLERLFEEMDESPSIPKAEKPEETPKEPLTFQAVYDAAPQRIEVEARHIQDWIIEMRKRLFG